MTYKTISFRGRTLPLLICILCLCCSLPCSASSDTDLPQSDEILIGMSLPLTGKNAPHAAKWLQGISAGISEINGNGGLHQKKLRILVLDDAGNENQARTNLTRLTETEKVFALLGAFGPYGIKNALAHSEKSNALLFGSSSGNHLKSLSFSGNLPAFAIRPDTMVETELLMRRFISETGKNRISVFYDEDEHGTEYLRAVRSALEKQQLSIHSAASANTDEEISHSASKLLASKPDAIIIAADIQKTDSFIRNLRENDGSIVLFVASHGDPIALAASLMNLGIGVVIIETVPFPYYRRIPAVTAYAAAVESYKKEDPSIEMDFPGFEAYLNVRAFAHILAQSPDLTKNAFLQTAHKQFEMDLGGFRFTFSENKHTGSEEIYLIQIAPGGFVVPIRSFSELYEFHP